MPTVDRPSAPRRSFLDLLPPDRRRVLEAKREAHEAAVADVTTLSDDALVAAIASTLADIDDARRWAPGDFVYDAMLYHVFVPECITRLTGRPAAPLVAVPVRDPARLAERQQRAASRATTDLLADVQYALSQMGSSRATWAAHEPGAGRFFGGLLPQLLARVEAYASPSSRLAAPWV